MTTVSVSGGTDGIVARLDDLLMMANLLRSAALSVGEAHEALVAPNLTWQLAEDGGHDAVGRLVLHGALVELAGPFGALSATEAHLDTLAQRLRAAVELYHDADSSVFGSLLGGLGHALGAAWLAGTGQFHAADEQFYEALPPLADLAAATTAPLAFAYAYNVPDGRPVVHDLGTDDGPASRVGPISLGDLITGVAIRDHGRHGEISVSFVVGADGRRRAIVDLPGTKSWNPVPNRDVTSVGTDIRALAGRDTAYEEGVFAAMHTAGVRRDEEVMLVGHSEGGIVAVDAARDAARTGRFRVTHVVTAGSPIGRIARDLPASVRVLALENTADVVPHCDGASNPPRPGITTVQASEQHDSIGANHDLNESYEPIARAADASANPSIRSFTGSARGFLSGTAMRTHRFWITRRP